MGDGYTDTVLGEDSGMMPHSVARQWYKPGFLNPPVWDRRCTDVKHMGGRPHLSPCGPLSMSLKHEVHFPFVLAQL